MNDSIMKLLKDRYFLNTESSWDDIAKRVSGIYPEIYENIRDMEFIPSSPTLMNANTGGEKRGTLSSCFTMDIEDSIEGIFDAVKEAAVVTRAGGGIGYNFSSLRSSSEEVKGIGGRKSSGPLPFINVFNSVLDGITQSGVRRGAGMSMLSIESPDIIDFIMAKDDINKFERFNFSIRVTDKFYKQLEKDPNKVHQVKTIDGKYFDLLDKEGKCVTVKNVWDKIIGQAWKNAEPGIFNSDIATRQCTTTNLSNHVLSNPCLPEYATVIKKDVGRIYLRDLEIGDEIWSKEGWTTAINKWSTGVKDVYEYYLHGMSLYCTENHRVISRGEKIEAKDAKEFDIFSTNLFDYIDIKEEYKNSLTYETCSFPLVYSGFRETCEVFDITVDNESHTFWCDGFNISNCQEFTNIPYGSCSLGSIDLSKLVTEKKEFNWDKLEDLVVKSLIFINNTFEVNQFPLDKIKETTLKIRPVGLGVMGLGHLLYKLEIPYNSDEATLLTEDIIKYITLRGMQESIEIAKKEGSYEAFDKDLFFKANKRFFNKSYNRLNVKQIKKDIENYGIRNSTITSIAPTGTISFISETSSGIEPVFALSYARKIEKEKKVYDKVYLNDPVFDIYIKENFNETEQEEISKYITNNKGSCKGCPSIPKKMQKVFVVAGDLNSMEHLDILEVVANNISMSVSKTINLPKEADKKQVSDVYIDAYKRNIIGVTCYRDGSREGILVHNNNEDSIIERGAPKRPKELPCHIYRITVHGEKWIVFVGLFQNHPYEIFSGKVDLVDIPSNIEEGVLIKIKKGLYQFKHNEEILIKDITKLFTSGAEEALTRQISTNLRHGTPIDFIIQQLEKSHGTVVDFNKSILRALKKYLKEGADSGMVCPECGNKLVFFDGCKKCSNLECTVQFCG